jgi:hypothetical protein
MSKVRISRDEALAIVCLAFLAVGFALWFLPLGLIVPATLVLLYLVLPDQREASE